VAAVPMTYANIGFVWMRNLLGMIDDPEGWQQSV
jgi:hypothetical protein